MKEKTVKIQLGKKLKEIREKHNKGKREIAKIIGVTRRRYRKIEKGKSPFYLRQGIVLAKYYGISLDDFAKN